MDGRPGPRPDRTEEDILASLPLQSWGVPEVKLLERLLRSKGRGVRGCLAEVQQSCSTDWAAAMRVAMLLLKHAEDSRLLLFAVGLLEDALASRWALGARRKELEELLKLVHDHIARLEISDEERAEWSGRLQRVQRLLHEQRRSDLLGDKARPLASDTRRGFATAHTFSHLRNSFSMPDLHTSKRGMLATALPAPSRYKAYAPAKTRSWTVAKGGPLFTDTSRFGEGPKEPEPNFWRARVLEHYPPRPRPFVRHAKSCTFFGGSQFTAVEPLDRVRRNDQLRCTASTF